MATLYRTVVRLALALGLSALAAAPAIAQDDGGYGYFRVVEGSVSVVPAGTDERAGADVNQPVQAGDRISVGDRSRAEVVLADNNILRVDGGSELVLERLAASPDSNDRGTVLRLLEGNIQLIVTQDSLGDELPRVETPNSSILPQDYGVYRITADRDWSQVVVRRGTAQVITDDSRRTVRADEEAVVDTRDRDRDEDQVAEVREAGGFDSLERWARQLDDESYNAASSLRYVDDNLRYQAAPLARYGEWIDYEGNAYWRPRVEAGWRPFWHGRWVYMPAGLTWVSSEPWGWVPYHYGSWDYLPAYGWVWRPGYVWSPAWVYWYWGPNYVGWCPTGYYTTYYAARLGFDFGFRFGVYGYAGGDWSYFDHWNFVSTSYFDYRAGYRNGYRDGHRDGYWDGRRDVQRYAVPIDRLRAERHPLERGVITTYTKPLKPSTWGNQSAVVGALRNGRNATELPDVTPFIARKPALSPNVARVVAAENPRALEGTPLRPGTLGKPNRAGGGAGGHDTGNGRSVQGAEPGARKPVPATPGAVLGGSPKPDRKPAAGEPEGRNERGRPAIEAGGSPNPRTGGAQGTQNDQGNRGNRNEGEDRNGRSNDRTGKPDRQQPAIGGNEPSGRERPERQPVIEGKPEAKPEARPEAKPNRNERPERNERQPAISEPKPERQPERRPAVEPKPEKPPVIQAKPEVKPERNDKPRNDQGRPPADKDKDRQDRKPPESNDNKPPAQLYQGSRYQGQPDRGGAAYQPRYEPRPAAPQQAPQAYRAPEPTRPAAPRYEPQRSEPQRAQPQQQPQQQQPQRSRGNDDGQGRARAGRPPV